MRCHYISSSSYNPGTNQPIVKETKINQFKFNVHKCTIRKRPTNKKNIVIIPIFSEFGSEILLPLYVIPYLLNNKYQGKYSIVVGWHGRKYLYEHLVDEFWEMDEDHQWLREYSRATHNDSRNLKCLNKKLSETGHVVDMKEIDTVCTNPKLTHCPRKFSNIECQSPIEICDTVQRCMRCGQTHPPVGIFNNLESAKKNAVWVPDPSDEKVKQIQQYLKPNSVGITARGRKCYGRNLESEFYKRLIYLLQDMGYNPIWLGEKATTQPCPVKGITDFSRMPESRDLEMTLAIVSQLRFTIQFWTASTRLAGLVGTPYILFESPCQIWGNYLESTPCNIPVGKGQEGYRLELCTKGPKKIVVSHFLNAVENNTEALHYAKEAILDVEKDNFHTILGQVDYKENVYNGIRMTALKMKLDI